MGLINKTVEEKFERTKEESNRIFWVVQTIFGFVIGNSFYIYAPIFIPPYEGNSFLLHLLSHSTLILALSSVYICVISSWIDYSSSLIKYPYQIKKVPSEWPRFISDLAVVLLYTYLIVDLGRIKNEPSTKILEFFVAFIVIYFFYILSGIFRRTLYGRKASNIRLIVISFIFLIVIAVSYRFLYSYFQNNKLIINQVFIGLTIVLTITYRMFRAKSSRRKCTIAVDVDGVLANQINGVLPIIKRKENIQLEYKDISSWDKKINDTSIDKIIKEEVKKKQYVLSMALHHCANEVIRHLIKKYRILIASARPANSSLWTKIWLLKNKIRYDEYYNLKEGEKQNASEKIDILIDDYIGNIKAFLEKQDGKAILFSQPWNQDHSSIEEFIKNGKLVIVNNWKEVQQKINELLKEV